MVIIIENLQLPVLNSHRTQNPLLDLPLLNKIMLILQPLGAQVAVRSWRHHSFFVILDEQLALIDHLLYLLVERIVRHLLLGFKVGHALSLDRLGLMSRGRWLRRQNARRRWHSFNDVELGRLLIQTLLRLLERCYAGSLGGFGGVQLLQFLEVVRCNLVEVAAVISTDDEPRSCWSWPSAVVECLGFQIPVLGRVVQATGWRGDALARVLRRIRLTDGPRLFHLVDVSCMSTSKWRFINISTALNILC